MNMNVFKVLAVTLSIAGVLGGAAATVKIWTDRSELGKKAKAQLKEEMAKK